MKIINIQHCKYGIICCGKILDNEDEGGFYCYYCLYTHCSDCIINRSIPKLYMDMED